MTERALFKDHKDFIYAVKTASNSIDKRANNRLGNVLIRGNGNEVSIVGTDGYVLVESKLPIVDEWHGDVQLPKNAAETLAYMVGKAEDSILLSIHIDDNVAVFMTSMGDMRIPQANMKTYVTYCAIIPEPSQAVGSVVVECEDIKKEFKLLPKSDKVSLAVEADHLYLKGVGDTRTVNAPLAHLSDEWPEVWVSYSILKRCIDSLPKQGAMLISNHGPTRPIVFRNESITIVAMPMKGNYE